MNIIKNKVCAKYMCTSSTPTYMYMYALMSHVCSYVINAKFTSFGTYPNTLSVVCMCVFVPILLLLLVTAGYKF